MQYEKRRRGATKRDGKRAKQDNPELDYAIITQMKVFMGEPEGRKLFFDTYTRGSYAMSDKDSIVNSTTQLKLFLLNSKREWDTSKPLLLVITYKNHYTGIRVDEKNITLFDPNYNHELYAPITSSMKDAISAVFENREMKEYTETCQVTNDEADSFCQTWSLYLLTHPEFKPPEKTCDRLELILTVYQKLLSLKQRRKRYTEFLNTVYLVVRPDTGNSITVKNALSIQNMGNERFVRALYATTEEFLNKNYSCLKL